MKIARGWGFEKRFFKFQSQISLNLLGFQLKKRKKSVVEGGCKEIAFIIVFIIIYFFHENLLVCDASKQIVRFLELVLKLQKDSKQINTCLSLLYVIFFNNINKQ